MNILEQEIEDVVWEGITNHPDLLRDRGFPNKDSYTYLCQFSLGEYGRADILGINVTSSRIAIDIIELKREMVRFSTLTQATRYAKGLRHLLEKEGIKRKVDFNIILIGKSVDDSFDFLYLIDTIPGVEVYTYGIDLLKGLIFQRACGHPLDVPNFPANQKLYPVLKANLQMNYKRQISDAIDSIPDDLPF